MRLCHCEMSMYGPGAVYLWSWCSLRQFWSGRFGGWFGGDVRQERRKKCCFMWPRSNWQYNQTALEAQSSSALRHRVLFYVSNKDSFDAKSEMKWYDVMTYDEKFYGCTRRNPHQTVNRSLRLHREKSLPICLPQEGRKKQSHGGLCLQREKSMVIHWEILCRSNALLRLQREKFFIKSKLSKVIWHHTQTLAIQCHLSANHI